MRSAASGRCCFFLPRARLFPKWLQRVSGGILRGASGHGRSWPLRPAPHVQAGTLHRTRPRAANGSPPSASTSRPSGRARPRGWQRTPGSRPRPRRRTSAGQRQPTRRRAHEAAHFSHAVRAKELRGCALLGPSGLAQGSCMPPHRGKPLAMTSIRRSSPGTLPTLRSLTNVCIATTTPASRQMRAAARSSGPPRARKTPDRGHIAKSVLLASTPASRRDEKARASAGAATATHGNARAPKSTPSKRGASRRPGLSTVRTGTAAWLQRLHPSCRCGQPHFASQELSTLLSATPARCQGHRPQHHVVAAHRRQGGGHGRLERVQDTATRHIRLKGISALDRRQAVSPRGPKRRRCMQPG